MAREVVPEVEGITDEASIADWDPPFPFDRRRVRATPPQDQDDRYWKDYGAAPKAFVALATARAGAIAKALNEKYDLDPKHDDIDDETGEIVRNARPRPATVTALESVK